MRQQTKPPAAPAHLSDTMRDFWRKLVRDYDFSPEHLHVLRVCCEQFDRCQECRERIKVDGVLVGGKRHPLLAIEGKAMELFLRGLRDLGLEAEVNSAKK